MKKLRVFSIIAVVSFCLLIFSGCSEESVPLKPTEKFFVNDFADVISDSDEQLIYSQGKSLQERTTAQVVAVTVDTVNGEEIAEYSLNLGREWGIGQKDKDNGILILLAVEDREVYISVGYGLEGAMPDSKTGRILDNYAIPYFSEDNFSGGLVAVYDAVVNEVLIENGIAPDEDYIPADELPTETEDSEAGHVVISWIILVVLVVIYVFIFKGRGIFFIGGPPFGGGFMGGSSAGRRGGSFGGGSFGGFSGGGGSFGGGGAGRGF
ncbi:MAG: TPM domain-containing protein [Oscillospiraceae bacterium]|nr:TPM domain-containing protein [Oscillospiraceae bacterium]